MPRCCERRNRHCASLGGRRRLALHRRSRNHRSSGGCNSRPCASPSTRHFAPRSGYSPWTGLARASVCPSTHGACHERGFACRQAGESRVEWWRRRELNPRPRMRPRRTLHACPLRGSRARRVEAAKYRQAPAPVDLTLARRGATREPASLMASDPRPPGEAGADAHSGLGCESVLSIRS